MMPNAAAALQKGVGRWSGLRQFLSEQSIPYHPCTKTRRIGPCTNRIFSKTSMRMASSKAQQPPKNRSLLSTPAKPTTPPKPGKFVSIPRNPAYTPYAQSLALRPSPTLLYQVHSQTTFTVGCYVVGGLLIVMSVINFYNEYLHPLERTWAYIPTMMAGVCLAVLVLGLWVIRRPRRVVQSISALPSSRHSDSPGLLLQIEKVKVFPGVKNLPLVVRSADVTLSAPLYQDNRKLGRDEEAEVRRRLYEMHRANQTRIMTRPFREARYWMWRAFRGLTRVFSPDPVIVVRVKGESGYWKMYKAGAWALDDGKTLDRLIHHKI